jgi:endonuclease YncB( thermonuclease family)
MYWRYPFTEYTVYDGDTIKLPDIDLGFRVHLHGYSVRLDGVDTPERYTDAGKAVTEAVIWWCDQWSMLVLGPYKLGKYSKRIIGAVWGHHEDQSLSEWLLEHRMANPYDGGTKEKWTTESLQRAEDSARRCLND